MLSFNELTVAVEIGVIYGLLALGVYLAFRTINFPDLTCDGSFVAGAAISSVIIKSGLNPFAGLFFAAIAGGMSGILTGILNIKLKIEDLLSGIIVAFMLYSINLRIMGTNPNISLVNEITLFNYGKPLTVGAVIACLLVFFIAYLLNSDFGLGLRSIGQNKLFASANGVNVNAMIIFGLALSNALAGMCGAVFTQYQGFCDVSQGMGSLINGLASVIIGEKLLLKLPKVKRTHAAGIKERAFLKIFSVIFSCIIGSVAYRVFIAIAINSDIFHLKTQDLNLVAGLLIIFVMRRRKKC